MLGKCGGLKRKNRLGDLVLPIAAIRGEGTSDDYLLPEVPALPAFALQRAVSTMIRDLGKDYWTGTVFPAEARFPTGERSTYTASAVVLAADGLAFYPDWPAPGYYDTLVAGVQELINGTKSPEQMLDDIAGPYQDNLASIGG